MKKGNMLAFLTAVVLAVSATSSVFAAAATAAEMKSDPDNYCLDPEEIRPIVRDSIEKTIVSNSRHVGEGRTTFSGFEEFDVRLVPGQIPMCTIEGDVAAYLYIAYAFPGPLPTVEEIISRARDSYEVVQEYLFSVDRPDWHEFFYETYPYEVTCAYEFVGVTEKWANTKGSCGIPAIITKQKGAEDAARKYYGSSDFELVRYIYCSRLNGYEFSNGRENIIVPFDTLTREVDGDDIKRRADVNANLEEFIWSYYPKDVELYFARWRKYLLQGSRDSGFDYPPTDYDISDMGSWCYLHQQYYDLRDYVWKDFTGLWDYEGKSGHKGYPLLKRRTTEPKQWALFGVCWGIAAASNMAYLEGTGTRRLIKNEREGDLVRGIDTTEKKFPYPAMRELNKIKEQPPIPPYPNNYAAYMSLLIGALYQNKTGCSFFYRHQDIIDGKITFSELAQLCADALETDFNADPYYEVWYRNTKPCGDDIANAIHANNPLVINYNHPQHGWHAVTCYGYEGYDPAGEGTITRLKFWDWYDSKWPDETPGLISEDYTDTNFCAAVIIRDTSRHETVAYVNDIEVKPAKKGANISWANEPFAELDVLGYNVVERDYSERRLNETLMRPDARFGGGKYKFKLPPGCDARDVAIQAVLKNGETVEYPVLVDVREAQKNAQ